MYIADLHIHSRYSRATSRDCTPEYLDLWARRKGIGLIGTGDFTHPAWREELEEKLEPTGDGFYRLKEEYRIRDGSVAGGQEPRFVVTGEISSIYKKKEKTRKVHSLILLPGLEAARTVSGKLETIGNIHSDGRPILGLACRDLLEILLGNVGLEVTDRLSTRFYCNCSKERVEQAVASIGRKDIQEMIDEGKDIEVKCHFCNTAYQYTVEDLKRILKHSR